MSYLIVLTLLLTSCASAVVQQDIADLNQDEINKELSETESILEDKQVQPLPETNYTGPIEESSL